MQQENLLHQDLNRELKEIKEQLKVIRILLAKKNDNEKSSTEKRFETAQKEKYSITLDHSR